MGGVFYGYREKPTIQIRAPGVRPQSSISPMKLSPYIMGSDGTPGFNYAAQNGDVPVDFAVDWITIPVQCRMATWTLRGGPVEIQVSFDGSGVGDQRVLRGSTLTQDAFIGYKIRQLVPGISCWYQLLAII